jgi:hypothetical protein
MTAVCEGAVQAVLDTVPPRICVVDAHARLIIPQVIAPFCVSSSPVQEGATKNSSDLKTVFVAVATTGGLFWCWDESWVRRRWPCDRAWGSGGGVAAGATPPSACAIAARQVRRGSCHTHRA